MKTVYKRVIGVDIASEKMDVNDSDSKITAEMPNTVKAIAISQKVMASWRRPIRSTRA
jgi:hypothetical protein